MSSVALVVVTDGRTEYLTETWQSFTGHTDFLFDTTIMVDDSGDRAAQDTAVELVGPDVAVLHSRRMGGAAAVRSAWKALQKSGSEYAFHLEDDWRFLGRIPVAEMVDILEADPDLANIVLRRQPWGAESIGGYIEANPSAFTPAGTHMIHRQGFWLNPGVYRTEVTKHGWPANGHEHDFSARLYPFGYRFGVYGKRSDPPRCWHIGHERSQSWTW